MTVRITIKGLDRLTAKLGSTEAAASHLRPVMVRSLARIRKPLKVYPPRPPNSTYRRTNQLGRAWTSRIERGGFRGVVGNVMGKGRNYAPYVQSAEKQAWMHKGHWQTDEDVVESVQDHIVKDFDDHVFKAL